MRPAGRSGGVQQASKRAALPSKNRINLAGNLQRRAVVKMDERIAIPVSFISLTPATKSNPRRRYSSNIRSRVHPSNLHEQFILSIQKKWDGSILILSRPIYVQRKCLNKSKLKLVGIFQIKVTFSAVCYLFINRLSDMSSLVTLGAGYFPAVKPFVRVCRTDLVGLYRAFQIFPTVHGTFLL
jgi:hypothetical protein